MKHIFACLVRRKYSLLVVCLYFVLPGVVAAGQSISQATSLSWSFSGVSSDTIEIPPLYSLPHIRDGDLQEYIPGVVAIQQYGAGMASHYFMRGENLIYGSGMYVTLDGMPLTLEQHTLANGYTDVNMIIPELVKRMKYKKGPYSVDTPGPAAYGHVDYEIPDSLDKSLVQLAMGQHLYFRMAAATSDKLQNGDFLYAVDVNSFDGPWKNIMEGKKMITAYIKQSWNIGADQYRLSVFGHRNNWNAPTPIPQRAVDSGALSELSAVNTDDEGKRRLMGVSGRWRRTFGDAVSSGQLYYFNSEFRFYGNNTYYLLDDTNGDQLEQTDRRNSLGVEYAYQLNSNIGTVPMNNKVGVQLQQNIIGEDGLYHTINPERLNVLRNDRDDEVKLGIYWKNNLHIAQRYTTRAGLRFNHYQYKVDSNLIANSGARRGGIVSGDFGMDYKVEAGMHAYVNAGKSYMTNQVHDVVSTIDPLTGAPVTRKDIFIPVTSGEIGMNYQTERVRTSVAVWHKKSDAEIIFSPERNTTISSRSSKRTGIEWFTKYSPDENLSLDFSATYARMKYTEPDPLDSTLGDTIPGIPQVVGKAGVTYYPAAGYYVALEGKYIGRRPLDENDTVESSAFSVFNFRVGYRWRDLSMHFDILNMFDNNSHEVDYLYRSRLPGEPVGGIDDSHYRILLPRTYRLFMTHDF